MKLYEAKQILNKYGYLLEDRFGGGKDRYGHKINRIKLSDINFDEIPDEEDVEETPEPAPEPAPEPKTNKVFSDVNIRNLSLSSFEDDYFDWRDGIENFLTGKPVSEDTMKQALKGLDWDKSQNYRGKLNTGNPVVAFGIYDYIEDQGKCYIGRIGKDGSVYKPRLLITWYAKNA